MKKVNVFKKVINFICRIFGIVERYKIKISELGISGGFIIKEREGNLIKDIDLKEVSIVKNK